MFENQIDCMSFIFGGAYGALYSHKQQFNNGDLLIEVNFSFDDT